MTVDLIFFIIWTIFSVHVNRGPDIVLMQRPPIFPIAGRNFLAHIAPESGVGVGTGAC